jgi:glucose-1-phosphate cytidylyltransferase
VKAVILAGGLGTRLSEETSVVPKPLVEIGEEPIILHIMRIYASHGIKDFIVCCGYKGYQIKRYFADMHLRNSSVTFDFSSGEAEYHDRIFADWRVTLLDTGRDTLTGGRVKRAAPLLNGETFLLTYGDGVGDIDIRAAIDFHRSHGKKATVTAVQPTGRFGAMYLSEQDPHVRSFKEKPDGDGTWINGGFFVLEPDVLDLVEDDRSVWELEPMQALTEAEQLVAFRHFGFWHPMDTLRDKTVLNSMWDRGEAPWKIW